MTPTTPMNDWGEVIMTSLAGALALFLAAIPKVIGFLIILLIGWFISGLLARGVGAVLRSIRFNDLSQRSGFTGFVDQMGIRKDASGFIADIVKWFVRLITLIVAFDSLGLPAVSEVLQELLLWLPNLIVALVILVIAGLAANALHGLVRGATAQAGFSNPDLLSTVARVAVWSFGIVVAVNQLGVAETLVNTLFFGLVGALALALGLSFGLGGRDTASEIVRTWYQQGQQAAPKLSYAVEAAQQQVQSSNTPPAGQQGGGLAVAAQVERKLLDQMREHGGSWTVSKATMRSHYRVLQHMAQDGRIELVREDADSATFRLLERERSVGEL